MDEEDKDINSTTKSRESLVSSIQCQTDYVEYRSVFTSKLIRIDPTIPHNYKFTFSFFQIITMFMDSKIRKRTNSLVAFIKSIEESEGHFSKRKVFAGDFLRCSCLYSIFIKKYGDFCMKKGFLKVSIEKNMDILEKYEISLKYRQDNETKAFTNVRFKTMKEKREEIDKVGKEELEL